jgi:ribosomal protein S16
MLFHLFKQNIQKLAPNKVNIELKRGLLISNNHRTIDEDKETEFVFESIPPLRPKINWPGNDNFESRLNLAKIKEKFKVGLPPLMRPSFIKGPLVIRVIPLNHCANRPFLRLVATYGNYDLSRPYIEDLGSIDPLPNKNNEILFALNIDRIKHYLGIGAQLRGTAPEILGKFLSN